jgi:thioredoxin 1
MRIMRSFLAGLALTALVMPAFAAETAPFTQAGFAAAQKAGKPILVDIWASWCPTCAAQKPILEKLTSLPEYKNLMVFRVDFDAQKDVVRQFRAQEQSTLIGYKGSVEIARSVGDTQEPSIAKLLGSIRS